MQRTSHPDCPGPGDRCGRPDSPGQGQHSSHQTQDQSRRKRSRQQRRGLDSQHQAHRGWSHATSLGGHRLRRIQLKRGAGVMLKQKMSEDKFKSKSMKYLPPKPKISLHANLHLIFSVRKNTQGCIGLTTLT